MKKPSARTVQTKLLSFYYGNPAKDMKLIAISSDEPSPLPQLIHSVLAAAEEKSDIVSATSLTSLHRALSKTWKKGTNFAIITAPLPLLHNLPLHALVTDRISSPSVIINGLPSTPDFLVLNRDDLSYAALKDTPSKTATKSFGHHRESDTRIDSFKPYKTAVEARLTLDNRIIDVAAFLTGDSAPLLLAAASTVADLLNIPKDTIVEGLASYEPTAPPSPAPKPDKK